MSKKPKQAAFAERVILSLKRKRYRYIEDHSENFIHKLPQFVSNMNCRVNISTGKPIRDVKNTDFLSILYNKPLTRYKKTKFKVSDRMRISMNDVSFRKEHKTQFTDEILKFWQYLEKSLQHASSKISTNKNFLGSFLKKSCKKVRKRAK